ncbi:MAG: hypothetical protein H0T42_10855 [Deltaproteobacteria bacterium]|nr:hypothetical protein [Deltaproteobacteria bacterium]
MTTRRTTWGGARRGAGRPRTRAIASEPHRVRPVLVARHPVHVITRVLPAARSLRRRDAYRAIRRAVQTSLARADFRIVCLTVRAARLELLVEADDKIALARGMQGFQVAVARRLNTALRRRGTVFPDRYRSSILATRDAVRAAVQAASAGQIARPHYASRNATATGAFFAAAWPLTWLLRTALSGRVRPRPRRRIDAVVRVSSRRG